uniref:Salicylate hydroxylase homolog 1 n=1 Tax=Fusarium oxysporum (strain Fo5176) TaxID=660025 RepID=A0A0C4DI35_FUSOF
MHPHPPRPRIKNIHCTIYEKSHAFNDIGAGLGISPNAQRAMIACDPAVHSAFEKVASGNIWKSKKNIVFDFLDGRNSATDVAPFFQIKNSTGLQGCHRGSFVNELLNILPNDVIRFNKHLAKAEDQGNDKVQLFFQDGTIEEADAIVGCDGIKSKMRELLVGQNHPSAKCSYTHKYAYRGMIPMPQAVEVLGEERALNATIWMGNDRHLLSYPVARGTILNVVAYCTSSDDWPSESQLTLPATRKDLVDDFRLFTPLFTPLGLKIIDCAEKLDRWGIFDLGDCPVPTFAKGRMCIIGDAAHASSPHHGSGAALCIEDAAVLASLLGHKMVRTGADVKTAFAAFDRSRRARTQWVVQKSRRAGQLYELQTEIGSNFKKVSEELSETLPTIWEFSIEDAIKQALADLEGRLKQKSF